MTYLKALLANMRYKEAVPWKLGVWNDTPPGYHLCTEETIPLWLAPRIFVCEVAGAITAGIDQVVVEKCRLVRELDFHMPTMCYRLWWDMGGVLRPPMNVFHQIHEIRKLSKAQPWIRRWVSDYILARNN